MAGVKVDYVIYDDLGDLIYDLNPEEEALFNFWNPLLEIRLSVLEVNLFPFSVQQGSVIDEKEEVDRPNPNPNAPMVCREGNMPYEIVVDPSKKKIFQMV